MFHHNVYSYLIIDSHRRYLGTLKILNSKPPVDRL